MTSKEYLLLLFIVACIGAGGYIYNDIIDEHTDQVNQKSPVVGTKIQKKIAWWSYLFIVLAPILPLISLMMELERSDLLWYYLALTLTLYLYNRFLKKLPLLGNVVIAALCGLAVYTPYYIEEKALGLLQLEAPDIYGSVTLLVLGFVIFAGIANLIREIIKDQQDTQGDLTTGHLTLPLAIGQRATSYLVIVLCILLGAGIYIWWNMMDLPDFAWPHIVFRWLLILPLINFCIRSYKAATSEDYARLSHALKIYFGIGLFVLLFITYNM